MAHKPNPEIRLDFLYDFGRREFILRFDSRGQAASYQTMNHEARILEEQPYDVWLPLPAGMSSLRSSSVGMAVVFQSQGAAEKWQKRTCLGNIVSFNNGDAGVYFKRDWSPAEMAEKIGSWRSSLQPPSSTSGSPTTRPNSARNDKPFEVNVKQQRASERSSGW